VRRGSCPARGLRAADGPGEQQLHLTVRVAADPLVEVAAAQIMVAALEELHNAGVVVRHASLQLDSRTAQRW
jgi:hypothetical protein